ncbi:granzyme K [Echinops telfairi]|uniref:Granzyme K n=1 Tax=Echinops telfairi TaxID=9371 RepID=A0ABM0IMY4_ECHTE|nr:granzyme K [Echinops telfairi]
MAKCASFSLFFIIAGASMTPEGFNMEIIGGREVPPHSQPFMASIQYGGDHVCGGVLIHPQWVLTAAHCQSLFANSQSLKVVLGAHSLSKNEASKQILEVKKLVPFSRFKTDPTSNDIMLIQLHRAVKLNKNIQPLHLTFKTYIRPGTKCQVTGWGTTNPDLVRPSDTLRKVAVTIISRKLCNSQSYYNHKPTITRNMVCAGDAQGLKDSCWGDSGGPLVCKGVFSAIVSGGHKCGQAKKPGVYILLTKKYQTWIKNNLAPHHAR